MPLGLHKRTPANIVRLPEAASFALAIIFLGIMGCGVKGDPVPPDKPPELGRGQPTYRKATEKIQLQKVTPVDDDDKKEEDREDE